MDRYDAILEQLTKAQRHGFDSLASHLDQVIVALERSLDSARSSLQNALPEDPESLFPIADVEAQLTAMGEQPTPVSGVSIDDLRALDRARSQSELLRSLLPILGEHVGRAMVLVLREGVVTAWSGVGFSNPDRVRTWQGGVAASPAFSQLVETSSPLRFAPAGDPLVAEWLEDEGVSEEAVLLPISLRGKLMGMVYVDHLAERPWNLDAAQALIAIACLLIDTLAQRPAAPSPTLAEIVTAEPPQAVEPEPEIFATPEEPEIVEAAETRFGFDADSEPSEPAEIGAMDFEEPADWQEPAVDDEVPVDYDFEPESTSAEPEHVEETFDPSATMRVETREESSAAEEGTGAQFTPGMSRSVGEVGMPPPVRPIEPPPPPPAQLPSEDVAEVDSRHEEARRFARLLVSEIKLYNEDEVDRGRSERDLALRLKEDIDRSREMYEKRIPPEVRADHDYFHDELVRILADGDPDALGM